MRVFAVFLALVLTMGQAYAKEPSGEELVARLTIKHLRAQAVIELLDRAGGDRNFAMMNGTAPDLVLCPQSKDETPIYLVLSEQRGYEEVSGPRGISKSGMLQPPPVQGQICEAPKSMAFFKADGIRIMPFKEATYRSAFFADLNGDGQVELARIVRYPQSRVKIVDVLEILTIREKPEPLLRVLINWDRAEWAARVRDTNGDGVPEVEIGPMKEGKFKPAQTYQWDAATKTYKGPDGLDGEHFKRLKVEDMEKELLRLEGLQLAFPSESIPRQPARRPTPIPVGPLGF